MSGDNIASGSSINTINITINNVVNVPREFKCQLCGHITPTKAEMRSHQEYKHKHGRIREVEVQRRLERELHGRHKTIPPGIVDLVTEDSIIEVKTYEAWKAGIGQLIAYGHYIPDKKKVLWLFSPTGIKPYKINVDMIRDVCQSVDIELMLEPEH